MRPGAHIHLIGVAGTAMGALAGLLQQAGYRVTGSDAEIYPPISTQLAAMKIPVCESYRSENLEPRPELTIIGNAISRGNAELEAVLDLKLPYASLPEILRELFLSSRETIAIAGTHGKTTVTAILSWIFYSAGLQPGFLIGGVPNNFSCGYDSGPADSRYFIIEADEYDTAFFDKGPKFLHYRPDAAILTSIEFDHADIYRDLEAVTVAFQRLINLIPRRGYLAACAESEIIRQACERAYCTVETYGIEQGDWRASEIATSATDTSFDVAFSGQRKGRITMQLCGRHNVQNALGAVAMASHYGIQWSEIARAMDSFAGVRRRMEVVGEAAGVTIVDDFAHHPTAIRETLHAARAKFPSRRIWALLEPRSNTLRRNVFENELADALTVADQVMLAGVFKQDRIPESERMNLDHVSKLIAGRGVAVEMGSTTEQIVARLSALVMPGDVIVVMSNGGFGGIHGKLLQAVADQSRNRQGAGAANGH
ncbi:MAG: UDP-N-acetylmuramate:L-alanyl-gamma-D-glutamyl-meso-diaminopimelate ligase [Acidobacteria bacterium]|nr:UDP-N-acetylmuramate:L-alanyl-gamma-D-glutamyl-meso-diaminopimelate ligase [Acidobacteriota bacterium]